MCISQISENIKNVKELQPFVSLIQKGAKNEHPKIRFAAAHALGQLADDLKPEFQEEYFE